MNISGATIYVEIIESSDLLHTIINAKKLDQLKMLLTDEIEELKMVIVMQLMSHHAQTHEQDTDFIRKLRLIY